MLRRAIVWTSLGLVLALAAPTARTRTIQDPGEATPSQSFGERVSVVEVVVPVRVRVGREPVDGLTAGDFEISDRGVRQDVVAFDVVDLRPGVRHSADGDSGAPAGRHLLLLFDLTFSNHFSVLRALQGAREMVAGQLHPADRAAVAYFSAFHGVMFVVGFTGDREQLSAALDVVEAVLARKPKEVRGHQARLARLRAGRRDAVFSALAGSRAARLRVGPAGGPEAELPDEPLDLDKRAAQTIMLGYVSVLSQSLADVTTLLRDVGGARHLLFFSEGFGSISPLSSLGTSILNELRTMRQAFLRTGWVLDSIDLKGIPVSYAKFNNNALFYLANETGGELYENYNHFEDATAKFLERSSVTYVLTYRVPDLVADGRFHKIEVKLVGGPENARVSHRPGYYAPRPDAEGDSS